MAFHIKNPETDALARKLAKAKGVSLTEAIHQAVERELKRERGDDDLAGKILDIGRRLRAAGDPAKGLPADKDFIDSLYE